MKPNQFSTSSYLSTLLTMGLAVLLASCGGGGGSSSSSGGGGGGTTTTINGKVTLSSTVTSKPTLMKSMLLAPRGKPGSKAYMASRKSSAPSSPLKSAVMGKALNSAAFASGTVYLYNADHPEWLAPVASAPTDNNGSYSLSVLSNMSTNNNAYTDGDPIPAGKYTLLAYKPGGFDPILGLTTEALVAVQTVVDSFSGTVTVSDMVAAEGTDLPTVTAMLGAKQNTDGTQTWGSAALSLPTNAAIQVNFSAPMARGSLTSGISISPAVSGKWTLSSDWTTATFYPDNGVTLAVSTLYTITVKGSDTDSTHAVKNVYGNALAKTATGSFTTTTGIDSIAPQAVWVSPTTLEQGNPVDVTKPIRIGANKQLDVNGLTLDGKVGGVSSLGAKPGILYVGQGTGAFTGYYIYEFVLGKPLQLNTLYDLSVSGGKGLNGKAMLDLTGSIQTADAASTSGIDPNATATTQAAQADVKDVFGKWIRAFSDRNITQLKSVMSSDFYFEDKNTDPKTDLNHDGRLSLGEFSDMLSTQAFPNWEYCGATITGNVVGNINVAGSNADFEFKMIATTTNTSQQCAGSVPNDSFYVTLQDINGAWTVVRASVGIDTRSKTISFPNLIDGLTLTQGGVTPAKIDLSGVAPIASWNATSGVSSYVVILTDGRDPSRGIACAVPTSTTSLDAVTLMSCAGSTTPDLYDVTSKFGFNNSNSSGVGTPTPLVVTGNNYYWEVIGLGSISTSTISSKTALDLTKDISAISALQSFTTAGTYLEVKAQVYSGATATGTPLTYSVNFQGYDAGAANQVTIKVTSPTPYGSGQISVSGNSYMNYLLSFDAAGVATQTIQLYQGWDWINVSDATTGLSNGFSISTTGGTPPVVAITSITDDIGNPVALDQWSYGTATSGAKNLTIAGTVTDPSITSVNVSVWNDSLQAYSYAQATVTLGTLGTFSTIVDIYKGDNWINISDPGYLYSSNAGVYTDTGTVWVPNIAISSVSSATKGADYGNSADWTATPGADGIVTIKGKFKIPSNGSYNVNNDGGWNSGILNVLVDGTFSLDVTLYNGWNYVSINDANYNWYGVNIYTTTGKTVVKPVIATVNGVAPTLPPYVGASTASVTGCTATVTGTAKAGSLNVNWSGFDGSNYWYESQTLNLAGTEPVSFSFSVPLVSGSGSYNSVDVFDANYTWTGVTVTTSSTCPSYLPPAMALSTTLTDNTAAVITDDGVLAGGSPSYSYTGSGATTSVTLSGTSSRAGRAINVSTYTCSTTHNFSTTAANTVNGSGTYNWSISGIPVYNSSNYLDLNDGYNWLYPTVYTTNGLLEPGAFTATVSGLTPTYTGLCGYNQWDAGSATSVTITGTTTGPDGTGNFTDPTGAMGTFTITGGSYSISNVPVYDGWNYIYLYDTASNSQYVPVSTTNGLAKPQLVAITAPANTVSTSVTGVQTVTGTITTSGSYNPSVIYAVVNNGSAYVTYSSDQYMVNTYGYSKITYDSTTGAYTFSADFGASALSSTVDVYGYDSVTGASHGATTYYNDDGYGASTGYMYYYKPGTKPKAVIRNTAVTAELMKHRLENINRNR